MKVQIFKRANRLQYFLIYLICYLLILFDLKTKIAFSELVNLVNDFTF